MMGFIFLIPVIMLIGGWVMYRVLPRKKNRFIGYRTVLSGKNQDTWRFANHYCGKLWMIAGAVMLVFSGISAVLFAITDTEPNNTAVLIAEAVEIIVLLVSIIPVEMKLKRNFDEHGNRR